MELTLGQLKLASSPCLLIATHLLRSLCSANHKNEREYGLMFWRSVPWNGAFYPSIPLFWIPTSGLAGFCRLPPPISSYSRGILTYFKASSKSCSNLVKFCIHFRVSSQPLKPHGHPDVGYPQKPPSSSEGVGSWGDVSWGISWDWSSRVLSLC